MIENFNTSYTGFRNDLLEHVRGSKLSILDVGCATGINGKYLIENGIAEIVDGIELQRDMASVAKTYLNKVFVGNLNNNSFRRNVLDNTGSYDYIVFGDILEHLVNPETVFEELVSKLKSNGKVIISLPNIAHLETFIQVYIKGKWPRNSRGIFDRTHLRWFTKKDAFELVENSGLEVKEYKRIYRSRDKRGSKFTWKYKLIKLLSKDLVTFQFIIIGGKCDRKLA